MRGATCLQVGLLIRKDTRSPAENETNVKNSLELGSAPDEDSEFTRLGFKSCPQHSLAIIPQTGGLSASVFLSVK